MNIRTVKELIKVLKTYPGDAEIVVLGDIRWDGRRINSLLSVNYFPANDYYGELLSLEPTSNYPMLSAYDTMFECLEELQKTGLTTGGTK